MRSTQAKDNTVIQGQGAEVVIIEAEALVNPDNKMKEVRAGVEATSDPKQVVVILLPNRLERQDTHVMIRCLIIRRTLGY